MNLCCFEYLLSHTVPAMLLLSCTFLKTHLSILHFRMKLHSSLARVIFERGSLFHKVLSVKTNGLSCTCVLIKCKFWVLVANFFFYVGNFILSIVGGRRRITPVALRWFHLCYKALIRIVDFGSLFCACVCVCV